MNKRFRRIERLQKKEEIRNVLHQRGVKGKLCTLYWFPQGASQSRLAVVVSRVVGKAVIRNRAKRRLREVFRRVKSHLTKTVDLAVRAHPSIREATYWDIEAELTRLLQKENLLRPIGPDKNADDFPQDHGRNPGTE